MGQKYVDLIKKTLEAEKAKLDESLKDAERSRREAPTSTESRSDTARARYEQLIVTLKEKATMIKNQLDLLDKTKAFKLFEVRSVSETRKYILVPDGIGGRKIQEFFLVSLGTPVGQKLNTASLNSTFRVNGVEHQVIKIDES